ncbi:YjbE family putative metal transport protein [Bacillus mangrovi]|uniref:YjbE family putative metal transport protein n=1 Tax=Metabacillus mangrovi TaxID=1491830 RepID=A0A7X2S417_9BACI|nr:TerC family protein [Metabacillus mangrovi]MTH53239.1 YjbE family putative metal transport protein [Metabacillus mangrovi]
MEQEFLISLLMIIGIDLVLGGDNAIVIAMASRRLPEKQRQKAIILGTLLAIALRTALTTVAVYLMAIPYLQLAGGIFLLYIAFNLMAGKEEEHDQIKSHTSLWKAVQTIVAADVLMGLDNVIAVAGAANGHTLLVVIGLFISIPVIIWGSKFVLQLIDRFPYLIYVGGGMLAYTAGKMISHEDQLQFLASKPVFIEGIPYFTVLLLIAGGYFMKKTS